MLVFMYDNFINKLFQLFFLRCLCPKAISNDAQCPAWAETLLGNNRSHGKTLQGVRM